MISLDDLVERRKVANNSVWHFGKIERPKLTQAEYDSIGDRHTKEFAAHYFDIETTV